MSTTVKQLTTKQIKETSKEVERLFEEDLVKNAQQIVNLTAQANKFNIPTLYKRFQAILHVKPPVDENLIMCEHTLTRMKEAIIKNQLIPVQCSLVALQIATHNLYTDSKEEWALLTQAKQKGIINHELCLLQAHFFLKENFKKLKGMPESIVPCNRSLKDHQTCPHGEALNLYKTVVTSLSLKPNLTDIEIEMREQAQLLFAELVAGSTCQSPKKHHTITAIEYANRLSNSQQQSFRERAEGCTVNLASKEIKKEVKKLSVRNILEETLTSSPAKTTVLVTKELLRKAEQYISEGKLTEARRLLSIEGEENVPTLIQEFNSETATSSFVSVPTALLELKCCRLQIQYLSSDGAKQLTKNDHEIQLRYKTVATWLHDKQVPRGTEAWGICIINDCENKHEKGCECGYTEVFKEWRKCQSPTIGMLNIQINSINDSQKGEVMSVEARNKQSMLLQKLSDHSNTPKEKRNYLEFKSIQMMAPQDEKHESLQLNRMLNLSGHKEMEVKARTWVIDHLFAQDKLDLAFNAIGQISKKELAQNQEELIKYYKNKLIGAIEKDIQDITPKTDTISINRLILYARHTKYIEKVSPTTAKSIKKLLHTMNDCIKNQTPPLDFELTMHWFTLFPQTLAAFKKSNPDFYFWYKGIEALSQKQFKKAEEFLLEACKQKGVFPHADLALGIIYKEMKDYEKALFHFENGKGSDHVQSSVESAQCHILSTDQPGKTDEQIQKGLQKAWDLLEPHGTLGKYYQGNMISRGMCPQKGIKLCKERSPHNGPCSHSATCEFLIKHARTESLTQQVLARYYREGMGVEKNRKTALAHARESVRINDCQGNIIELIYCLQQGTAEETEESYELLDILDKTEPYTAKLLVNFAMKDLQLYRLRKVLGENGILSRDSYTDTERADLRELLKIKIPELHTLWETSTDFTEQSALVFSSIIFDLVDIAFGNDQSTLPKSQQVFIQDLQRLQGKGRNIADNYLDKQEKIYRASSVDILLKLKNKIINREDAQWALAQKRLLNPGHSCENLKASILPFLTSDRLKIGGTMETTLSKMIPQYLIILFTMKNFHKVRISTLKVIHDIIQRLGEEGRDITIFKRTLDDILFTTLFRFPSKNILAFTEQKRPLAPFVLQLVKENKHSLDMSLAMVLVPELRHLCNKECETNNISKDATLIETAKEIHQHLQVQMEKSPPAIYLVGEWERRLTELSNAIIRLERVRTTGQPAMPSLLETLDYRIIKGTEKEQTTLLTQLGLQSVANGPSKCRKTQQEGCFDVNELLQLNELLAMVHSYQNDCTEFAPTLTFLLLKLDNFKHFHPDKEDIAATLFNLIISLVHTENKSGQSVNILHTLKGILTKKTSTERKFDPSIVMNIVEYCKSFFDDDHQEELQLLLIKLVFHARYSAEPGDATLHDLAHQFPQWFKIIDSGTKFRIELENSPVTFNLINTLAKSAPDTLVGPLSSQNPLMEGTQQERTSLAQELQNLTPLGATDKFLQLINPEEIMAFTNDYNRLPRANVVNLVVTLILKLDQLRFYQQDNRYEDVTNILHSLVLSCLASELNEDKGGTIALNILVKSLNSKKCPEPEILAELLKSCAQHLPQTADLRAFVQSLYFYTLSFPTKRAVPALKLLAESFPDIINIQTINGNREIYTLKDSVEINVPYCIEQYETDQVSFRRATAQLFGSFYQDKTATVTMEAFLPLFTVACKKGIRISNDGDQLKETIESAVISNMRSKKHILLALEAWEDVIAKDTSIQIQERFEELYTTKELHQVVKKTYPDVAR